MSRIDQALEKAVQMREAQKSASETVREETVEAKKHSGQPEYAGLHKFVVSEGAIDSALLDRRLVSVTDTNSAAAEQYKKLRARILKATQKNLHNTIMITSPNMSEGKSVTAVNLALAVSQTIDHTVLLVDADLRRPSLHRLLGIEPRYGLSDYLQNEMDLSEVLIKTGLGKLVFLPGGNPSANPAELLSSEKMKTLVHEMKLRYRDRYIIFDSAPLLVTADTISLANYMDGLLFVIQAGKTSEKSAVQALSLMKGWNILGIVYNNVSPYLTRASHDSYYGYDRLP